MDLKTPLAAISGIGLNFAGKLKNLELFTVENLIHHYPFRYDDFSKSSQIAQAKTGEVITIIGEIWSIKNSYTRNRKVITKAIINDGSGTVETVWFNQPWLTKTLKVRDRLQLSGKVSKKDSKVTLVFPQWEKLKDQQLPSDQTIHTGRLVPIYPETMGISSKWLRFKISKILPFILPKVEDSLPDFITDNMLDLQTALYQIHFPKDLKEAQKARDRLAFDELFYVQLSTLKKREEWRNKKIIEPLKIDEDKLTNFIKALPFELTQAQHKVILELTVDLQNNYPMNRLVQGEVGSGKTVVAATIIYLTHLNGLRSILMAPTEILAFQHHQTLSKLLNPYGIEVGLYTGSRKFSKNNKKNHKSSIINHHSSPNVIVGTHALLSEKLNLDKVGLVVIDEQQRFGVLQRSILRNRANFPHFLTMTATPIPRTIALTVYGDLDLSIINELPKGRKNVSTHFVPPKKRGDAYEFIKKQAGEGKQIYIITPLIEESETLISAKAAKVEYERLKKEVFLKLKLGLLHGRMKSKEKEQAINDFKEGKIDILVSTSVVEVGVDVPNATIMVIEGAERFGLAALHQLRGRVGRGVHKSYAFLFTETLAPQAVNRVKNLERIQNGLKLAEMDLKLRGSGEVFGTKQSGVVNFKIASLTDLELLEKTREAALQILAKSPNLDKYPPLQAKLSSLVQASPD